jgi:hypothetical protein
MVIPAAEQGHAGRGAQCRGVKLVVAQPVFGQSLHRRHVNRPAEGAGLAEPHVVDQHDEDVRRFGRRLDLEPWRRRGIPDIEHRAMGVLGFRDGQHRAVGRQHHPCGGGLLGGDGYRRQHGCKDECQDYWTEKSCLQTILLLA